MYPVLLKIGSLSLYTYGLFVAVSFIVGVIVARHEAGRLEEDPDKIMDLCFYALLAAIVGSRLFYVLTNLKMFISDPMEIFKIWNGGLVFYGGFIGAFITAIIYLKKKKIDLFKTADIMAPPLAIGHAVGRMGCFHFPAGDYIYLGSAQGPGGLRARLGRHLLGSGKHHWHIDHLRAATQVRGFGYQIRLVESGVAPHLPLECVWSQKLAALSGVNLPVPDFGASDCRSGCRAHLVHIPAGGQQTLKAITDHMLTHIIQV